MISGGIKRRLMISFLTLVVLLVIYLVPSNVDVSEVKYEDAKFSYVYLKYDDVLVKSKVVSKEEDVLNKIKEAISYLTIGSNKSNYISGKLKPIIPKNTILLESSIDDGIAKLNFSKEFKNSDDLEAVLEAIVYSLTEIDGVNGVMLFIDGEKIQSIDGRIIALPHVLTRDFGINKIYDITSVNNVKKDVLYYYTMVNDEYAIVPVTLFSNDDINKVDVIIEELSTAPIYYTNLTSFLSQNTKLLDYELEENIMKLNFSNVLLDNFFDDSLLEEVKYAISLSLKDSLGIEEVSFFVQENEI